MSILPMQKDQFGTALCSTHSKIEFANEAGLHISA